MHSHDTSADEPASLAGAATPPSADHAGTGPAREQLSAIFESAGDGLYVMGPDTLCTYLNPAGARMLGYPADELVGKALHGIVHHTHVDGRPHPVEDCPIAHAALRGIDAQVGDDVFWHKDGSPVPVAYSASPLVVDGRPAGAVVTFRNIGERKRVEAEREALLRAVDTERARLAAIFELSPSFMAVLSGPDHVFERANAHYLDLIGQRAVLGLPLREALPETVEQGFVALLDDVYRNGRAHIGSDVRVVMHPVNEAPRELYGDFVYQPIRDGDSAVTGVLIQGIDITERKRTEAKLLQSDERLNLLVEHVRDYAIVISDPAGCIAEWLGDAERITGFSAEDAIGSPAHLIFTPEDIADRQPEREMETARRTGKAEDRRWHQRKDGSRFFANGVMVPLTDAAGALRGYGKLFRDETRRQREADQRVLLLAVARHLLEAPGDGAVLAEQVFAMVREPLDAEVLLNYRVDADGGMHLVAASGIPDPLWHLLARIEVGQTLCGQVALQREPLVADAERMAADPEGALLRDLGMRSFACHPLLGRDGRVLGTFTVASRARHAFAPDEVQLLQAVSHFLALAWDRHYADQALALVTAQSERRRRLYETALNNTPDLAYVFDLEHRFTFANEILLRIWGRSWDEAIGRKCLELGYEPWHAEMREREIDQVKATRAPIRGEVPFTGTYGRRIYDYILTPVFGPDGEVEAVAGTGHDITERKQADEERAALLAAEQRRASLLARVAETSRTMTSLLSADSAVRVLAEEARAIIGAHQAVASLTMAEDWSQAINAVSLSERYAHWRDYAPVPDGSGIYAEVCRTNQPMRMTQDELQAHPLWRGFGAHAKDHPAMRGWLAVPLIGHGGRNLGLVQLSDKLEGEFTAEDEAVLVQLASIAAAGIENARLYDELREQDRRKDEFLATLAHELRNPLAPIRTGLTVLEHAPPPETAARTRQVMARQVGHMVRLIDDLLDISRITTGKIELKKEHIDAAAILDAALETSRPAIEAGRHGVFVARPSGPLPVEVDPTRMAQVVGNLLNNAARYTPEGGRIELSAEREGGQAVIRVRDNGMGLEPQTLGRVFDLFTQVDRAVGAQGGLGIGLALVQRLVEMHGGTVAAESGGLGAGATFIVRLPLAATAAQKGQTHPSAAPVPAPHSTPRRILVVDDNADAADTLTILLQLDHHETRTVYSGPDAVQAACEFRPEIVFLDIGLPGMNGYEVAQRLRGELGMHDTVLVALTGWGTEDDRRRARAAGFDQHLTKPVTAERVQELLAKIAAR